MKSIFFIFSYLIVELSAGQTSGFEEKRYQYRGTRGLGMGGTQISTVNDETTLFINPANLLRLRNPIVTVFDIEVEASGNFYSPLYQTTSFNPLNSSSVFSSLNQNPGENYYFRSSNAPSFVSPYFGISLLSNQILNMQFNSATNQTQLYYRDDQALFSGFAIRLFSGIVKIGFSGKIISRNEADTLITQPIEVNSDNFLSSGTAIGFDTGVTITLPIKYLPTVSLVTRDLGTTKFDSNIFTRRSTTTKPTNLNQSTDIGFSLNPIHASNQRSIWSIELHQINSINNPINHLHFGYEYNLNDIFFTRFGFNQSYWTAGLELASERMQFQISTYGEEIGQQASTQESRRFALKLSYRF